MNTLKIISLFVVLVLGLSCKNAESKSSNQNSPATNTQNANPAPNIQVPENFTPTTAPPQPKDPPQNAKRVWHFICAKGCEGGAGSAVPCPKCGTQLVHNQAYHQQ